MTKNMLSDQRLGNQFVGGVDTRTSLKIEYRGIEYLTTEHFLVVLWTPSIFNVLKCLYQSSIFNALFSRQSSISLAPFVLQPKGL